MPYSRAQLLDAVRTDHPELKDIDDNRLFAAIAVDHPDLAKGISELQERPSRSDLSSRSAVQVAEDQAANVLKGIPEAVTGIPGAVKGGAQAAFEALRGGGTGTAQGLIKGAVSPIVTPVNQAIELARPGLVNAPTPDDPETAASARGAGSILGAAALEGVRSIPKVQQSAAQAYGALASKTKSLVTPIPGTPAIPLDAPAVNKWMGVPAKEVEHGANPGQQLMSDNLLGAIKEATKANVDAALKATGNELQQRLIDAGNKGVTIDAQTPTYDSAAQATKRIGAPRDAAFQAKIDNIVDDIESRYPDLNKLTPADAHKLKVELGDAIDWHGEAYDDPINKVKVRIYAKINEALKADNVGVGDVQTKWGNLYSASKNLKRSLSKDIVGTGTGSDVPATIPAGPEGPSPAWNALQKLAPYAIPAAIGGGAYRIGRELLP